MEVILVRIGVVITAACLGGLALCSRATAHATDRRFLWAVTMLQISLALGLFFALYVVGGREVTADVPGYYLPPAHAVMSGKLPYRDFPLSYAPLFPYVGAGLLAVWDSGKIFVIFAVVLNALILLLWHSVAAACVDRSMARESSILYATSGQVLLQVVLGTNQLWTAAAIAVSTLLMFRGGSVGSGMAQGISLCVTKFLALLFWPVFFLAAENRFRWLAGAGLFPVVAYGGFAAMGADVIHPIQREGQLVSSGNLPYLLSWLVPGSTEMANRFFDVWAFLALAVGIVWLCGIVRRVEARRRSEFLVPGLVLIGLVFMLMSKKSYGPYVTFVMYPLILSVVRGIDNRRARFGFLLGFNGLLAVESSLWFHIRGNGVPLGEFARRSRPLTVGGFVAVDLVLVACYAFLLWLTVRYVRTITWERGGAREISASTERR